MLLILNDINDLSLSNIIFFKDKIYYKFHENKTDKMIGIYFKYTKKLIDNHNYYLLEIEENIIPLFKYLNLENKFKIIKNKNYIEIIKNKITTQIFNDMNDYLILSFKSVKDNNFIKIHILQWKN